MLMVKRLILSLCFFTLSRSFRHNLPVRRPYRMTKTLRNFFASTTTETDSSAKRVKTELVVQATTETDVEAGLSVGLSEKIEAKVEVSDDGEHFGWQPFDSLEPGWRASLASEFHRPYFQLLMKFLATESKSQTVFPPSNEIFTALNLCPLDQVKVGLSPKSVDLSCWFVPTSLSPSLLRWW